MSLTRKTVLVIIPTYNEAANIRSLLEEIFSLQIENLSVLVVDDNSPDLTYREVERMQKSYVNLRLLKREKKLGLAHAYKQGFDYALKNNFEIIIQMDGDLSHPANRIPEMLLSIEQSDCVIGSRYVKGGCVLEWDVFRLFLSRYANFFCNFMLGIPVSDLTSGFKCLRRKTLQLLDLSTIKSEGYSFQIEITRRIFLKKLKIKEIPIDFKGRKKEKSKFSFFIAVEAFCRVLYWSLARATPQSTTRCP
jgi:dolichol-phosphate mannosyltransferase